MTNPRSRSEKGRALVSLLLILLVLGMAAGFFTYMKNTRPEAERVERVDEGILVEVTTVARATHEVRIRAQGTVRPARQVVVIPEVGGRVRWHHEQLVAGGRVRANDTLLRIDARDYRLAVEASTAEVNRAELELQMERGRQAVAQREWASFGDPEAGESGRALATRDPQLRTAQVGVVAANSSVERARLNLSRTTIRAPFNAMVTTEAVEVGQVVGPQSQLATLVGTDEFWIQVSVPVASLASIVVSESEGSEATVVQDVGGQRVERTGRVVRLLPDLDPNGAMARVIVSIPDPLDGPVPLLLGSFVGVEIDAPPLEDVIEVPRAAVHEGNVVYVMSADDTLETRRVSVVWGLPDSVMVSTGLDAGDRVIRSQVGTALPGMRLRTAGSAPTTTAQASPDANEADATQGTP
ncbi:MAG: efflux RND transporter periplasmic adaptor subunit [Polyangiales bacterium]|nr:efflux RND transporter periplasmic adaptor subunit [Myxococcales bacterium]MCB9661488.1 efflux RND transporter periplasmic adaptor subunit [Sandaracinaceae bacterium]